MFGIRTVKSGVREKEEYYTQDESLSQSRDEHYAAEQKQNRSQSHSPHNSINNKLTTAIYHGLGATKLGLKGAVTKEEFKSLFYGYKPGTTERIRGKRQNQKTQENLAEDITLSPSKSFSIAFHHRGDERLYDAHVEAVKEVANIIEAKYIQTREYVDGVHQRINTGNMIAALIPHHTSRDNDMQIHHHLVIFNGTQRADGKYCAMKNVDLNRQKWLGHLYQSILARKVQKLGYSIRETKDGFELEGISREQIEVFSKRSREIVKKLKEQGKEINPKNRDAATLTTRKAKNSTQTLEEYRASWRSEAEAHGIKAPIPQSQPVIPFQQQTALDALNSAIAHLSEPSVSFKRDKIYEYIYQSGLQSFSFSELEQQIQTHKELIPLNDNATELTTVKALKREIDTAKQWLKGQHRATPLLSNPHIEATKLNQGQAEAIKRTLTSTDKHQIIHGLSGVGKTTALGILRNQLRKTDVVVKGFAPTIEAAEILSQELDIKTNTVAYLTLANRENKPNQLWIIDEAGLMSANQAQTTVRKAELAGARLLLVGDKGQNSSIEAGSPLRSLMKHGATTHSISEIIRQRNSVQKQAVELIANGKGSEALFLLENKGYVSEIQDDEERTATIAHEYLKLSPEERTQTLLVTGTNKERLAITQEIRNGLKAEGKLGSSIKTVQLTSRNLTREQRSLIDNYKEGDYIQLFREYKSANLQKGQLYKVERVEDNELVVSSSGGRLYRFDPAKYRDKQVFTSRQMEIAVGDKLRWSGGSDKNKGQINGKQVTVKAIDELSVTVEDKLGQRQQVSLLQPLPLDHNLVSTSYRAQGKSRKRVLVSATSDPTSSLEPFYVKISRQTEHLLVYTANIKNLRERVQKSNAQKNPIELIEQNYGRRTNARNTVSTERTERAKRELQIPDGPNPGAKHTANSKHTESIHPRISGTIGAEKEQRSQRVNRRVNTSDEFIENHNRRISDALNSSGRIVLKGLDDLASVITETKEEARLAEALLQTQDLVQQFDRDLQLQKLDALDRAISPQQSSTVSFERLDSLASTIAQTQKETRLSEALKQTSSLVEQFHHDLQVQKPDALEQAVPFTDLDVLASAIAQNQEESQLSEALQQTSSLVEQFYDDLQVQKTDALDSTVSHQQSSTVPLEGLDSLAKNIVNYQTTEVIAQTIAVFDRTVARLHEEIQQRFDTLADSLSKRKLNTEFNSPRLTELIESFENQRSIKPFWQPMYDNTQKPQQIEERHWEEFKQSVIHPDLVALNAQSLEGREVYEYLLDDRLNKLGKVQYVTQPQKKVLLGYETVAEGGWWGQAGIDALSLKDLTPGEKPQNVLWGCFKPDNPRIDQQKSADKGTTKYRKYENPSGRGRVPFLPEISDRLAEQIYQKHGINPTAEEKKSGFWYVVKQYPKQIPITVTEGFKKTLASLSQGQVTIGLTGVNHIYRSTDEDKNKLPQRQLNPEVAVFADPEREFRFAYDQDTKAKTIVNVRRDMVRGIELLESRGCNVKVLKWNAADGKGLDDLIAESSSVAYAEAHNNAISSDLDKKTHYRTEYNKLAKRTLSSLGNNISSERLDLEVYIAAVLKGERDDGVRVIGESDRTRDIARRQPKFKDIYLRAISQVAGSYRILAQKNDGTNLDNWATNRIKDQMLHLTHLQKQRVNRNRGIKLY